MLKSALNYVSSNTETWKFPKKNFHGGLANHMNVIVNQK